MKKVLFAMFALSVVGIASAQSYGHGQMQNGHNGYNVSANAHDNYRYNNGEHNNVVFSNESHFNGHGSIQSSVHGYSQPVYGGLHGTVIANDYHRQELDHNMRRYNNGHGY